jgi:hypothetical protein
MARSNGEAFAKAEGGWMDLFGWFKTGGASREHRRLAGWRKEWSAAVAAADTAQVVPLRARLDGFGLPEDDVEIEREMLDALQDLGELTAAVRAAGLPVVETGHRAVGTDRCHFTAPVSMPDEPAQPSGRLLLTSARAIFVGGANGAAAPWHSVGEALHVDRDVVLVRSDREKLYRFRCNTFSDALRAAFLARELMAARRRVRPGL